MRSRFVHASVLAFCAACSSYAQAENPQKETRDHAYFRGREDTVEGADIAAGIGRVVLSPVRLLFDALLREPIDGSARVIEKHHVIARVRDVFHPTPDFTWYPTLTLDLGVYGAVGVHAHWDHALARNHEVDAALATGGFEAWQGRIRDDFRFGPTKIGVQGKFISRRDRDFYGLGPDSKTSDQTQFGLTAGEAIAFVSFEKPGIEVQIAEGYSDELTGPGYAPSIETKFDTSTIPGFGKELGLARSSLDVKLDSRGKNRDEEVGGVAFIGNATYARDLRDKERAFVSATADLQVAFDVIKPGRILTLRAYAQDTFALGSEPVPFTHQAMLGWTHHYGFYWGRFRGEAAVMAEARWRYPVAYLLDMMWIASTGNVFKHDFSDFSFGELTGSLGVGFRTRRTGSPPIEVIFAAGTTRFDEDFGFDSGRVYLSTSGDLL